jgi:cytochrome c
MIMKKTKLTAAIFTVAVFAATALFAADGKALYTKECAKCHGADGKGETKMGKKMEAKDYSNPKSWEELTDAQAIKAVTAGYKDKSGKVIMKPTEGVTEADAKAIIEYMKSLKK